MAGLVTTKHEFSLPFHEWKTAFGARAFPLVKKVCAVNLGSRISARFVGAERSRNACQYRLRVAQIKGIFEAWDPDEILQAARRAIGRYTIEKHSVVTRIPERKSRFTLSILGCKDQLRVPRHWQRPRSLCANAAQPIRSQE